ncbi:uncharacterized protein LOC136042060 isoform X2 [Artemia franciscana]|uniref:uncharacterized protein LOC136042060 isoform X2 n=1 Tax=Artemia franciscana TaxID=6661 RepID=UPI0032DADB4D
MDTRLIYVIITLFAISNQESFLSLIQSKFFRRATRKVSDKMPRFHFSHRNPLFTVSKVSVVTKTVTVIPKCILPAHGLPDCEFREGRHLSWIKELSSFYIPLNSESIETKNFRAVSTESFQQTENQTIPEIQPSMGEQNDARFLLGGTILHLIEKKKRYIVSVLHQTATFFETSTNFLRTFTLSPLCRFGFHNPFQECEVEGSGREAVRIGKLLSDQEHFEFWSQEMDSIFSGEEDEFMLLQPSKSEVKKEDNTKDKQNKKYTKECEVDWKMYCDQHMNCKCYFVPNWFTKWSSARKHCSDYNAQFITIKNNKENKYLSDFLSDIGVSRVFIGASRLNETHFHWSDGSLMKFDKWEDGEPKYDCVIVLQNTKYNHWATAKCDDTELFVCRKDAVWAKNSKNWL